MVARAYENHFLEFVFFFFNDTATTEIYTLSLHDALPIFLARVVVFCCLAGLVIPVKWYNRWWKFGTWEALMRSEEHTSELQSPVPISYAVFCLKKKTTQLTPT